MRWRGERRSTNVEDRRGQSGPRFRIGPRAGAGAGGGLGLIILILIALALGVDPIALLNQAGPPPNAGQAPPAVVVEGEAPEPRIDEEDDLTQFVEVILASTEDVWATVLPEQTGVDYEEPKLVLFRDQVGSACGFADSAVGPFYCPADRKIYLDLAFFDDLRDQFDAPGDFAQAYVIAHEVGHHIQTLLGTTQRAQMAKRRLDEAQANEISVRIELQADYLAGVWAHHAERMRDILEPGDIEEGINAAQAIGDDRLQRRRQGYVVPDSFTHGTSEQRARWFLKGFRLGDMSGSDTFAVDDL